MEATTLQIAPDAKWIQTATGRAFWPLSPRSEDVCIEDIAHALSMKCRYTGHTLSFYSVAQHSWHASMIVPAEQARGALLHDATEAYMPDVARPVKKSMPSMQMMEADLANAIAAHFGMQPEDFSTPEIKHADLVLLATERRDLMSPPPFRWTSTENIAPMEDIIKPMNPHIAKHVFLSRYRELFS